MTILETYIPNYNLTYMYTKSMYPKIKFSGWRGSIGIKAFALHSTNLIPVPGIDYGSLSPGKSDS